ncbi:MAG TPA: transglycosylase SLT domain-containing protein, partial [Chloroflexota bacterium]|nr:transglycosylase SLT domain-containing protein [Chloroflexota bacterium]
TGIPDPFRYLRSVGELSPLAALPSRPASSPTAPAVANSRVECIIAKESGGANVSNRQGSGAGGVMQYLPSTFAAHAREMGHPEWSLWNPAQARAVAAHDLALGRRAQWTVGGC